MSDERVIVHHETTVTVIGPDSVREEAAHRSTEVFEGRSYSLEDVRENRTPGDDAAELVDAQLATVAQDLEYLIRTRVNGLA